MKKILLTALIVMLMIKAPAQFNTNLVVSPQPPGSLLSWGLKDLRYLVVNQTGANRQALIKSTFKLADGTVVGTTNLAKARIITIAGGNSIFEAPDVIPLDAMQFTGKYKTSLDKTGKLPADNYQLCVQLVTPVDYIRLSEEMCRPFNLASFQLSIPVMPANDILLDPKLAQTAITFRWTPISPRPVFPVTYRIMVFEVLEKQQPVQAMRSNLPLLVKDVTGTTQYIWQPQLGMIDEGNTENEQKAGVSTSRSNVRTKQAERGNEEEADSANTQKAGVSTSRSNVRTKQFVWTIQALDQQGIPFGDGNINGDGISEPAVFLVGKEVDKLKEEIKK